MGSSPPWSLAADTGGGAVEGFVVVVVWNKASRSLFRGKESARWRDEEEEEGQVIGATVHESLA